MPAGLDPWALAGVDSSGAGTATPAWYDALVNYYGVPPDVARAMVNNPSYAEGVMSPSGGDWPYAYRGRDQEMAAGKQGATDENLPRERNLGEQMWRSRNARPSSQNISYQPGAGAMAGGWDPSGGSPGQSQMTPDQLQRWQTIMRILGGPRGAGGMVNPAGGGTNPLAGLTNQLSQGGGLMAALVQNPQLLQWFMQQQGTQQQFPGSGGGVTLADLLTGRGQTPQSA